MEYFGVWCQHTIRHFPFFSHFFFPIFFGSFLSLAFLHARRTKNQKTLIASMCRHQNEKEKVVKKNNKKKTKQQKNKQKKHNVFYHDFLFGDAGNTMMNIPSIIALSFWLLSPSNYPLFSKGWGGRTTRISTSCIASSKRMPCLFLVSDESAMFH